MLSLTQDSEINFQGYKEDLESLGYIYTELDNLIFAEEYMQQEVASFASLCRDIMSTKSGYFLCELNEKNTVRFLKDYENCPPSAFTSSKTEGDSLNADKVLTPLLDRGYAKEFITTYMEYKSKKAIKGLLKGLIDRAERTDKISYNGKKLYKVYFTVNEADNLRVYYRNHSIQNIPKLFCNVITAPKGYFIVSGDFKQSDMRIAYSMLIRNKDNLDIMNKYEDKYEGFSRILLNNSFNLDEFKENRDIYKVNALAPLYGSTHSASEIANAYIRKANEYLKTAPNYKEFKRRIQRRIDLDLPVKITSYFGNTTVINDNNVKSGGVSKSASTKKFFDSLKMNKALNAPIQTGTSEIVIACEQSIMREFAKVGATPENGGIYAYVNRHDELLFMVSTDYIEYCDIFRNHEVIQVDDWIPLKVDFIYQKYYTVPDEELTKLAKSYYKSDDLFVQKPISGKPFIPAQDVLEISIGTHYIEEIDKSVISYYDYINNKCSVDIVDGNNGDKIYNEVLAKLVSKSQLLKERDINSAYVCTQLVLEDKSVFQGILMKFTRFYDSSNLTKSSILAEYGACLYCKSNGVDKQPSSSLSSNIAFVKSVIEKGDLFKEGA